MAYRIEVKEKCVALRKRGLSINEIAKETQVAKATLSEWLRDVELDRNAKELLISKIQKGRFVSAENKKNRTQKFLDSYFNNSVKELRFFKIDDTIARILCATLYRCEGSKNQFNGIKFTNSDPMVIKTFLYFFRRGFSPDERRMRVLVHLHEYHDKEKQLAFWSNLTKIPRSQFTKPYLKPHTGKRIREDYQGCVTIGYYNNDLARQLLMAGKAFFAKYGGMV